MSDGHGSAAILDEPLIGSGSSGCGTDPFNRTEATGLGEGPLGIWHVNDPTKWSVNGAQGITTGDFNGNVAYLPKRYLNLPIDWQITFTMVYHGATIPASLPPLFESFMNDDQDGNRWNGGFEVRPVSGDPSASARMFILLDLNNDQTFADYQASATLPAGLFGIPITCRCRIEATQMLFKVWDASLAEPAGWNLTVTGFPAGATANFAQYLNPPHLRWQADGLKGPVIFDDYTLSGCRVPQPANSCEDDYDRVQTGAWGESPIRFLDWIPTFPEDDLASVDGTDGVILGNRTNTDDSGDEYMYFGPNADPSQRGTVTDPFEIYFEFTPTYHIGEPPFSLRADWDVSFNLLGADYAIVAIGNDIYDELSNQANENDMAIQVFSANSPGSGSATSLAAVVAPSGVRLACRFRITSSAIMAKLWPVAGGEPGGWTVTDSTGTPLDFGAVQFGFEFNWESPSTDVEQFRIHKFRIESGFDCDVPDTGGGSVPDDTLSTGIAGSGIGH